MTHHSVDDEAFHGGWVGALRRAAAGHVFASREDAVSDRRRAVAEFRDESGNRRLTDQLVLCHVLGLSLRQAPSEVSLAVVSSRSLDVMLWGLVLTPHPDLSGLTATVGVDGPLGVLAGAVEVATEVQLASLHALTWLALRDWEIAARVHSATTWLLEHLEPDNATRRPWGIHAFIARASAGDAEAGLYASAMLHACCVEHGRPDRVSALILLDGADWLEARDEKFSR
ncbi:MAG: hypothetical protein KF866_01465 [Phycisphaeraceae bacterium]|nr:hypothetical protein [Phycisphaeraceae bacterium]MCW5754990.1 hypothetical protein [Phycisphaeraceae bacterium]